MYLLKNENYTNDSRRHVPKSSDFFHTIATLTIQMRYYDEYVHLYLLPTTYYLVPSTYLNILERDMRLLHVRVWAMGDLPKQTAVAARKSDILKTCRYSGRDVPPANG